MWGERGSRVHLFTKRSHFGKERKGKRVFICWEKIKITQGLIIDYESHSVCFILFYFFLFFSEIIEGSNNRTSESWAGRRLEYWKLTRVCVLAKARIIITESRESRL